MNKEQIIKLLEDRAIGLDSCPHNMCSRCEAEAERYAAQVLREIAERAKKDE